MSFETFQALLLPVHAAATFYMVGLIWFVQRVQYPLFAGVGEHEFPRFHERHVARTGPVVGPPMLVEAATALALLAAPPASVPAGAAWAGLGGVAVVWLSTALLQVPRHRDLGRGFEPGVHRRLVATNWIRTVAWSLRGVLVLWMLVRERVA